MARFDWYQATIWAPDLTYRGLGERLLAVWELADLAPDRGMHGYTHGAKIVRGERTLCRIWWGGNPGVNVTATSDDAPALQEALQGMGFDFHVTRADACVDWVEEGLFDSLSAHLIAYAKDNGISINQQGDWARGQARTLYLGSPQSPVRICLYEKGYEQGGGAPLDWTRLEVRVKPKGDHRRAVAGWTADQVMGCGWVADALQVLGWDNLHGRSIGTVWKPSDAHASRLALLRQYGSIIESWAVEQGGWDGFGSVLQEALQEVRSNKLGALSLAEQTP